ncbi:hypothetical protein CDEST_02593 [Colletotrichum destructivum]|uniref:Uncharacterized protein n=1 Tax=Colletotrichum destructivum TaxID=34406 RepID=A0AAX4I2X6_9PEZI|nr:hypothetical protein CDEST_02593 [Colletotrichum destructivum]
MDNIIELTKTFVDSHAAIFNALTQQSKLVQLKHRRGPFAMRTVCKEAWLTTEEHGTFEFGFTGSSNFGFQFNPSRDIVLLTGGHEHDVLKGCVASPQIFAVGQLCFRTKASCINLLHLAFLSTDDCRKINLVHFPVREYDTDMDRGVKLFALQDYDAIWNRESAPVFGKQGSAITTLGGIITSLLRMYRSKTLLQ